MGKNLKLCFLVITTICYTHLFAQVFDKPEKKFAVMAGANVSNMNFNNSITSTATPQAASWKPGISIGCLVRIELMENLYLQPEYYYLQRNGDDKSKGIKYTNNYLSLPVLLNYNFYSRFAIVAGPQFDLLINARSTDNGINTSITHDVEERSIGATVGLQADVTESFFASIRYMHGLNHIGIGQRSNVKEFKYQGISLLAGIRF
ncbi:MAG: porin family protein [Ferruginibacter sp.]